MSSVTPRILVVDDEITILESLGRILEKEGYIVDKASGAIEAQNLCSVNFYSAIILDCLLPQKTGLQLAKEIKPTQNKDVHFIFMSGVYSNPAFISDCLSEAGGSRFYTKPFNAKDLVEYLATTIKGNEREHSLLENLFTVPNLSVTEVLLQLNNHPKISGFELPFILAQFSRLKINRQINIYYQGEILCQLRFQGGNIIQLYSFMENYAFSKRCITSIDDVVSQKQIEIQVIKPEGVSSNVFVSATEILSWAEMVTFNKLPVHWIQSRLFPVIGCKIFPGMDVKTTQKVTKFWPIIKSTKYEVSNILGRSLLQLLQRTQRQNEDLFRCVYNYFLNGSAWVDSMSENFKEESLDDYLSWHYNSIVKANYFESLDLEPSEEFQESQIVRVYKQCFNRIFKAAKSERTQQWIEFNENLLKTRTKTLLDTKTRVKYFNDLQLEKSRWEQSVSNLLPLVLNYFEEFQPHKALKKITELGRFEKLSGELKMIYYWAYMSVNANELSHVRLDELLQEMQRVHLSPNYQYLRKVNEGFVCKLKGDSPTARRHFVEAKSLNPKTRVPDREMLILKQIKNPHPKWLEKLFAAIQPSTSEI